MLFILWFLPDKQRNGFRTKTELIIALSPSLQRIYMLLAIKTQPINQETQQVDCRVFSWYVLSLKKKFCAEGVNVNY